MTNNVILITDCGTSNTTQLNIAKKEDGGTPAEPNEFRWMVVIEQPALFFTRKFTGILISSKWILTHKFSVGK